MKIGSGKWAGAVCCICGAPFSCSFKDKPYCNKHWLRMYNNGTIEPKLRARTNKYEICGDKLLITTAKGDKIVADAADYEVLSKFSWCISKTGYPVANINGKTVKLHRYLLGVKDVSVIIDHINGDPLDNRRQNLRVCTNSENTRNCKVAKNNTSGYTGIRKIAKSGRYNVRITFNRQEIHIGNFENIEDAIEARIAAEKKYFGSFAPSVCRSDTPSVEVEITEEMRL